MPKGRAKPIIRHWPACFYEPPEFPTVPGFNDLDADEDTSFISTMTDVFNPSEVTFFYEDKCAVLNVSGSTNSLIRGPMDIAESRLQTIFDQRWTSGVDAVLPNRPKLNEFGFLFCGDQYITFTLTADAASISSKPSTSTVSMVRRSYPVVDHWKCLRDANFKQIDTAFEIPGFPGEVWFFSGNKYIRASWEINKEKKINSQLLEGPLSIVENWKSLKVAQIDTVDMLLLSNDPQNPNHIWVFSEDAYVQLAINPKKNGNALIINDTIVKQRTLITEGWPALQCFYG